MFGYVITNAEAMSQRQITRYRSMYCGLCRALGSRHGLAGRLTLNYDMAFVVLLLSSLYEPEQLKCTERCAVHPMKKHLCCRSEASDYAADMNVALAYFNSLDDWRDSKKLRGLVVSTMLKRKWQKVNVAWPRQCRTISKSLSDLEQYEKQNCQNPDLPANCFGKLMGELLVWREDDYWADTLRQCGSALGRFIYILDAVDDLMVDIKHKSYNPLQALYESGKTNRDFQEILTMLIGECTAAFEKLPLVEDVDILRNILYSGVWTRFPKERGEADAGSI